MSASVSSSRTKTAPSTYKTYSNAIAEYTATVERLRARRNSGQDTPSTRRDSYRDSSLSRDRSTSSSSYTSSYIPPATPTGYVSRVRSSLTDSSTSSASLAARRQSWRSSIVDLSDERADTGSRLRDALSDRPPKSSSYHSGSDQVTSSSAGSYATLPKRRTYTREESLDRAREILAKSAGTTGKTEPTTPGLTTITAGPVSLSGRSYKRDSTAPPSDSSDRYDSGVESVSSSRASTYDRSRSISSLSSSGSSYQIGSRRLEGVSSAYSSRLSSRETSPARGTRTPEMKLYGMHRDRALSPEVDGYSVTTETPGKEARNPDSKNLENSQNNDTSVMCQSTALSRARVARAASIINGEPSLTRVSGYSNLYLRDKDQIPSVLSSSRDKRSDVINGKTEGEVSDSEQEVDGNEENWRSRYSYGTGVRSRSPKNLRRSTTSKKAVSVSETDTAGLTGLRNIGNTCFMNSILQCLSNTRDLRDYCLSGAYQSELNSGSNHSESPLVSAFATVLEALWKKHSSYSSSNAYDPDRFHRKIQQYAPRFSGYLQQDAQEFLRYLLEGLHEDVNRVTGKPKFETQDIDDSLSDTQKSAEAWKRYLRRDNSKIVDLYVGQLKSSLVCDKCGHCSVTFDAFWDLALPIPGYRSSALSDSNIYDCFKFFTKKEVLDGDERPVCGKCKTKQRCTKFFAIQKFPRYLVIHLKRFSQERYRAKISSLVEYPVDGLDLTSFAAEPYSGPKPKYNLYAVSCHAGSTHCGHYTAYCKHPVSGSWNEYNDSRVNSASSRDAVTSDAYVLFYEQVA